jgi:hypothetical protein
LGVEAAQLNKRPTRSGRSAWLDININRNDQRLYGERNWEISDRAP